METLRMLTILVLLMVSVASGDQQLVISGGDQGLALDREDRHLTVNGEEVNSITLGAGRTCTFEVVSGDYSIYIDNIGFDDCNSLGILSHIATMPAAGGCPDVNEVNEPNFCGYRLTVGYCPPYPNQGVHFVFKYIAQEIGETDLKLYDISLTSLIDTIHITVRPDVNETAFTYQGQLYDGSYPANDKYDFEFKLYNAPKASDQQGDTIDIEDVNVIDGYFTVELDFGSDVFDGETRWLEIGVRPGEFEDPNTYTTLSPRQKLTPTPYATYARTAGRLSDSNYLPAGVIVMWSGSTGSIPSGWALCDGTNGTPDLRGRFIVGAGSSYSVGSTGGEATHTLTISEMPSHSHNSKYNAWGSGERGDSEDTAYWNVTWTATTSVGGNQPHENRPPYYALAYIMKL